MGVRRSVAAVFALLCALAVVPAAAQARTYIVGYDADAGNARTETAQREQDAGFDADHVYTKAVRGFAADLSAAQVEQLQDDPDVAYVVRDRPVQASGAAVAIGETIPTGVRRLGAATTTTVASKSDVAVAVLDTGVDLDSPDIDAAGGKNCIDAGASSDDDHGHGTHVAGTIAATNGGAGVVGVAPGTKIYSVKVLNSSGNGTLSGVICGIDWVSANSAALNIKVANMSLGGYAGSVGSCVTDPERAAICRATELGVTFVVAAGNEGRDIYAPGDIETPGSFPEVLTVTAFGDSDGAPGAQGGPLCSTSASDDGSASFSNWATRAQDVAHMVAGPGVCIRSVKNGGGTTTMSGTSMATPHIAGAVALCLSAGGVSGPCSGMTPAQIIDRMKTTAQARAASFGFQGDPLRPLSGRTYGYAVSIAGASATTGGASGVSQTSGNVSGVVYPAEGAATARFEYGRTTGYGAVSDSQTVQGSAGPTSVAAGLVGLQPGTTYHYRLTVSDASGTSVGADRTFTTPSSAPLVPSTPITPPIAMPSPGANNPILDGGSTSDPNDGGGSSTKPVAPDARPTKLCKTWRARYTKAKKALATARRAARARTSESNKKKLRSAEASFRKAKARVKRYC